MIIGCGPGRSGTKTLATLLGCTHEEQPWLPWIPDPDLYQQRLSQLSVQGDVASSYLPYLPCLLTDVPDVKIVVTRRDAQAVAASFEAWMDHHGPRNRHHWYDHGGKDGYRLDPQFDPWFPKYDIPDRFQAIVRYVQDYDAEIDRLKAKHPNNIMVVNTDDLSDENVQKAICRFAGVPFHYVERQHERLRGVKLLVGTYRKKKYVAKCLKSVEQYLSGYDDVVFIDDSGDDKHATWLAQYGQVVATGGSGFQRAYQALCEAAGGEEVFVMEEDFRLTVPVNIAEMSEHLFFRPYLSQVALLRGPCYGHEEQAGGVLEFLASRGHQVRDVNGLVEVTGSFTCNPSLWRGHVSALGWPQRDSSEVVKARQLGELGYRGSYLPGIRCLHVGEDKTGGHSY